MTLTMKMPKKRAELERDLETIKNALHEYHCALDKREHGGVAADKFIKKAEEVFKLNWHQRRIENGG